MTALRKIANIRYIEGSGVLSMPEVHIYNYIQRVLKAVQFRRQVTKIIESIVHYKMTNVSFSPVTLYLV